MHLPSRTLARARALRFSCAPRVVAALRIAAALLVLAPLAAQAMDKTIVVLPLDVTKAQGKIDAAARASVEDMIRDEAINALGNAGWTVLSGDTTIQLLKDNGIDPTKCDDSGCHLSLARDMTVPMFISGAIEYVEGTFTASIHLIETKSGRMLAATDFESPKILGLRSEFRQKALGFFAEANLINAKPASAPPEASPKPANQTASSSAATVQPRMCEEGKQVGPDTAGQCCWPGQVWSGSRCVGTPVSCPDGMAVDAQSERCIETECTDGRARVEGTRACCWPDQLWSKSRAVCVGRPSHCPSDLVVGPDGCKPHQAGDTMVGQKSGLTYVYIPAGSFHFGCEPQDKNCADDEKPGRTVSVGAFWLGKTDVTVAAYQKCVDARACTRADGGGKCNWGTEKLDHPINCVDWSQARSFCRWIDGRLPTAEEWEYAAKGGESRIYPWGNEEPNGNLANYDNSGTTAAGAYPSGIGKWGLLDMAGNVWQWTASGYDLSSKEQRGGAWFDPPQGLRASLRRRYDPSNGDDNIGFRCGL